MQMMWLYPRHWKEEEKYKLEVIYLESYDENKATDLLIKKRHNKKKVGAAKKNSRYKRVNDNSSFRNNARHFQYDYEEDYYEPPIKK